jgi:hypothetical protein
MSRLAIKLFCNDCKRSVIMEREFFLEILLKWRDSNPDSNEEEIITFRCDECALSLMRRVPNIHLKRSFSPYIVEYWTNEDIHFLAVYRKGEARRQYPHVTLELPVIHDTPDGRMFVGQAHTDRLPRLFEIKCGDDEILQELNEQE